MSARYVTGWTLISCKTSLSYTSDDDAVFRPDTGLVYINLVNKGTVCLCWCLNIIFYWIKWAVGKNEYSWKYPQPLSFLNMQDQFSNPYTSTTTGNFFFSPPMPPHVLSDFVVSHPRLWLKCNRLLKLGRPVGAVTLSRWEWWWNERWIWGARGALNLISTNYPDHGHHGRLSLSRKNAHGRAGNRTRDLMVSSQELWPPSHEAGHNRQNYSCVF